MEQRFGLRRDDLIARDVPAGVVEEKLREYRDWQQWRDSALEAGAQPSVQVKTAGEWARSGQWLPGVDELPPVDELSVARDLLTPSGRRFGSLVHAVLANAVLGDGGESVEALAQVQARLLGAPAEEADAAAGIARGVLTHPILQEAARAAARGACRREMPVTFSCPDGTVIEGVVDLAFEDEGRWTVVDFKTDIEIGRNGLQTYRRQVGFYGAAITRATSQPARGVLLRI